MKEENKGLYIAIILSVAIIFLTNMMFPKKDVVALADKPQTELVVPEKKDVLLYQEPALETNQVLNQDARIAINNSVLKGSLRLKGARIDEMELLKYKKNLEKDSPNVELFAPLKTKAPYFAEFGWLSNDANIKLPTENTIWNIKGNKKLSPLTPIVLEYSNGQGLNFIRKISLDENYMFSVEQAVENTSGENVTLYPFAVISKTNIGEDTKAVVHEGFIGVLEGSLKEVKLKDVDKSSKSYKTNGGWLGFSDKYWFSSIIANTNKEVSAKFSKVAENTYQADYVGAPVLIENASIATDNLKLFVGAKEIKLLDKYTTEYNINKFDLAVDFGWYYFLTKPFFYILDFLFNLIGNMGWAILLFAALLRLAMFPIANKSFESMSKMKKVQPQMKILQERFKEDKVRLQQETMALYRKEKINPASGCLPMLIQIPVFFSLYKVLNIAIEIRHAPFIGWLKDLSAPDPMTISVITHLPIPSLLNIGVWPIVMGVTMYLQQKLNPAPVNKDQARMFAMMPIIFTFMMGHFASGLVIYWTLSNILSILQQKAIMKKNGVE